MNLSEHSVRRPVTVLMVTVSVLVLGYISLLRLPLALLPDFSSNNLRVFVSYPSSSPEEVERSITRPLEESLSTLNNLERMESTSSGESSSIRLEFRHGTDMDLVSLDIRDRIDQVRNLLPEDVERVVIRRFQSSDIPVFRFAVGWSGDRQELYRFVEETLKPRLERIEGVANVEERGVQPKEIIVEVDPSELQAYGLDMFNLAQSVRENNRNVSGGWLLDGGRKLGLRSVGEFRSLDEIRDLPLGRGRFRLSDLATVRLDFPDRESFARLNGHEAVTLSVYKASTANVVGVCREVRRELEAVTHQPPYDRLAAVQVFLDQSDSILKSLNDLKRAGMVGGLLAMVVLFLFLLKFRSTLIISVAIPISIVFTCALMYLMRVFAGSDITLNVVSMMGLMVAVGMLVDNSVVVLENIFRYKQEKGLGAFEAAMRGSREVGMAVIASTATTVVVFVSFIFMPNSSSGRFLRDFGVVVSAALVASLLVALTVIPMLSSRIFTGRERPKQRLIVSLTRGYGSLMGWMLRWRIVTLILLGLLGYGSYWLLSSIDREFFPNVAERQLRLNVLMEKGFSLSEMEGIFAQAEKALLDRRKELEIVSVSSNFSSRTTRRGQYRGDLNIYLRQEGKITPTLQLRDRILATLPVRPGVEYRVGRMHHYGGGSDMGVEVQLVGEDPALLEHFGDVVKEKLSALPGVRDVQTTLESGDDEIHLVVNRKKAEKMGVPSARVARTIASALSTRPTSRYKSDNGEVDIVLQLKGSREVNFQELQNIEIQNREGGMVPLYALVDYEFRKGPMAVRREDRKSVLSVVGNSDRGAGFMLSFMARNALKDLRLPPGYSWTLGRQFRRFQQSEQENLFSIVLALIFMYIIMAALFESFVHPLTILVTVPFSIIGVAGIFYLTSTTLNQMAYLGILVLFGIVVNNGIILVDHINRLRQEGHSRQEAIRQGGMDRLRPILMTAATSIFGLLPLTLPFLFPSWFPTVGGRARMWAPVSLAVFGGLTTSTFLTVIILPVIYSFVDDLGLWARQALAFAGRLLSGVRPGRVES